MDYPWGTPSIELTIGRWKCARSRTLVETIYSSLEEAYMSVTFGYSEPPLIRMGKGFHDTLVSRMNLRSQESLEIRHIFNGARVICEDHGFDTWSAHIYMYDRSSFELPILFVAAVVELVDGV